MTLLYALVGIAFFLVLILVAVRLAVTRQEEEEPGESAKIHASGIYSVVRQSPRRAIGEVKPAEGDIRQYLSGQNVNLDGRSLSENEAEELIALWNRSIDHNLQVVEEGDRNGVEFYFYDLAAEDAACDAIISKGHFVTREQIFKHPRLIPPFHLGCRCGLKAYRGDENLNDTTEIGIRPFVSDEDNLPPLPHWQSIVQPQPKHKGE
jgi:hypothetical protein